MSLPNQIEVESGGDRRLFIGLWLVWIAALLNILFHAQAMPLVLQLVSAAVLLLSVPRSHSPSLKKQHLCLHASGSLSWGEEKGRWHKNTWRSPWYTVIRVQTENQRWWAWISASNNPPDAYRQLGIWCRFSPQQPAEMSGKGHTP